MDKCPKKAEQFNATTWTRLRSKPSVYLPGNEITWTEFLCPSCGAVAPGENGSWPHGKTVHCKCGLNVLCFGLMLNIWREETPIVRLRQLLQ